MIIDNDAQYYIQKLEMLPHPEGGYYKETYRSKNTIKNVDRKARNISTAIFFLLERQQKSHLHKIKSDELWFHHQGETLEIIYIQNGQLHNIYLGSDLEVGEVLQATIPANTWFASRVKSGEGFSLVSCTVAPGFDFEDFEMARKADLILQYPNLETIINEMCLE